MPFADRGNQWSSKEPRLRPLEGGAALSDEEVRVWIDHATVAFKGLASLLSIKLNHHYIRTLTFLRRKVTFSLLDSAIIVSGEPGTPPTGQPMMTPACKISLWTSSWVRPGCLTDSVFVVCSLKYLPFLDKFSISSCLLYINDPTYWNALYK